MRTIPTDELKAVEDYVTTQRHWFDETDPEPLGPEPALANGDSEVFVLAPDQSITLPDSRVVISGPGYVDVGRMNVGDGETWYRLYFVQGVNQRGRTCAYSLSAT